MHTLGAYASPEVPLVCVSRLYAGAVCVCKALGSARYACIRYARMPCAHALGACMRTLIQVVSRSACA